jgi:hypothetical protein
VRALWGSGGGKDADSADGADSNTSDPLGPFGRRARSHHRHSSSHSHNSGRRSAEAERRRRALLDYALGVQPSVMDEFSRSSPPSVVAAMRATVANMIGTLPPAYFEVRVLTEPQTLAHLFFSAAMTGWMFRNCVLRLELRSALAGAALDASPAVPTPTPLPPPPPAAASATPPAPATPAPAAATSWSPAVAEQYAPGAQKDRVEGDVLLWHLSREEVERVPAPRYIEALEGEVSRLRRALADAQGAGKAGDQASRAAAALFSEEEGEVQAGEAGGAGAAGGVVAPAAAVGGGGPPAALQVVAPRGGALTSSSSSSGARSANDGTNPLLDYLRALDPKSLSDLTAGIGDGAAAAVDAFVARMLGVSSARDGDALRRCDPSECSAAELGRALYWLMVVGYTLRSLEMQLDLEGVGGGGLGGAGEGGEAGGLNAVFAPRRRWKWPSL